MDCHSTYAETVCPERCTYARRTDEHREHSHWRCDEHGHTWVHFPRLDTVDWFDFSQPARLIYPDYSPIRKRRRGK